MQKYIIRSIFTKTNT